VSVVAPTPGLDWAKLAALASTTFPVGWPTDELLFLSPRDTQNHQVILACLNACQHSLIASEYGFTDPDVAARLKAILSDPQLAAIINLDSSQAAGPTEAKLLAGYGLDAFKGTSIAVGQSIHSKINHDKIMVIDGWLSVSGSTNLSLAGEQLQNNELRVSRNPFIAARLTAPLLLDHAYMLAQMKKKDEHMVAQAQGGGLKAKGAA
jgi:phosphatidylserine/phosphatidylglycerophosphate/cardiolipin synthase-like enzyme